MSQLAINTSQAGFHPTGSSVLDALQDCLQHDTFQEESISKLSFNREKHEGKGRDDGNKSLIWLFPREQVNHINSRTHFLAELTLMNV